MYREWLKRLFLLLISSFIGIIIFNFFIDPYNIFDSKADYSKKETESHMRLHKAISLKNQDADVLLLGDSQPARGINPEILKRATEMSVFNSTFENMTIYELRKYLELALHIHKPKYVVAGLQMYNFTSRKYTRSFSEAYLDPEYNHYKLLYSFDTLKSSIITIKDYLKYQPEEKTNGLYIDTSTKPYKSRFLANEHRYISHNAPRLNNFKYDDGTSTFDNYQKILELCHENNIKLILFISPSHARQYEATAIGNGWKTFEEWKKRLVTINENVGLKHNAAPFQIWDFSGYHKLNSEEIPSEKNSTIKMKYYYESSHFTPALGDIVLDRIFDKNLSNGQAYPDFGVKITTKNLSSHFDKIREQREIWRENHTLEVQEIETLAK